MKKIKIFLSEFHQYVEKPWYPYIMGVIAFVDYFLIIIPLDAMVVASIIACRKRWFMISLWTTLGSSLGAVLFSLLIQFYGIRFIQTWFPHLLDGDFAHMCEKWLHHYGSIALFVIAAMPLAQHPTVAIATLAQIATVTIGVTMLLGRFFKYCVYSWFIFRFRPHKKVEFPG